MKKTKIITMSLLLATLAVGCTKDDATIVTNNEPATVQGKSPLRLFVNDVDNNGSKVSFDPTGADNFAANWIENEWVLLNGTNYQVGLFSEQGTDYVGLKDNGGNFIQPATSDMTALYPGKDFDDNKVVVNDSEIILKQLGIKFTSDGKQSTAFPMYANTTAGSQALYFNHLTCGIQVRLKNTTGSDVNIAKLTIVAQSDAAVVNLGLDNDNDDVNDIIARWETEVVGPWVPMGPVGQNGDAVDVKFSSVMNFVFKDESNNAYKSISNGETLKFCVPVTISSLKYLKVAGYDENDNLIFYKKASFGSAQNLYRNNMYSFPVIEL